MEVARIKLALEEGGDWFEILVHSLEMPRGAQWDAVNGWRANGPDPAKELGNEGALARRAMSRGRFEDIVASGTPEAVVAALGGRRVEDEADGFVAYSALRLAVRYLPPGTDEEEVLTMAAVFRDFIRAG
jgi:hypothetical protein